ncbi:hypothetical protein V6M85_05365 [Sulfolobus tengchongensis]|uniref:Uncharacterized protein n=1 Tax=Sulfolobus tengchongensis TaxID=207809 RepID=A0AAX4L5H3_9CREN
MSVKFEESKKLIDLVKSMLVTATSSILVVTYSIDQEAASEILTRAASGVNTLVVTSDKNWARWLINQREAYKKDEENRLKKELERSQSLYKQITYFTIIIPVLIGVVDLLLLLFTMIREIIYLDLLLSLLAIGLIVYYGIRRRRQTLSQISVLRENLRNLVQETSQIRNEIKEKLKIIEVDKQLSFSILSCDDKAILFSAPFRFSSLESSIHILTEISKDIVNQIVNLITSTQTKV